MGSVVVVLLAAAAITLGSFKVPVPADQGNAVYILFALSVLIFAMFLVFGLILTRSLVRLWAERRTGQMGSRFKVKMVLGAMGVSLLPLVFLFFFSYALVNRTLNLWFPRPLEIANEQSQLLLSRFEQSQSSRLNNLAAELVSRDTGGAISVERSPAFDAYWVTDSKGQVTAGSDFKTANQKARMKGSRTSDGWQRRASSSREDFIGTLANHSKRNRSLERGWPALSRGKRAAKEWRHSLSCAIAAGRFFRAVRGH